jgi:cytochrome P450
MVSQLTILMDTPRGRRPLQWMRDIPNDGLIHFRGAFNTSYLIATNHQALLDIMSTNTYDFEKPWKAREFLARIIGFGLILSEGNAHRVQRKALTPAFNIKNIRGLYGLMWDKTNILLGELEKEARANPMEGLSSGNSGKVEMTVWAR